jgi:hypothetical protein
LVLLAGCAHEDTDAPRAQFEPRQQPVSPLDDNAGMAIGNAASAAVLEASQAGSHPKPNSKACGGGCKAGEYCDQSSGVDRCLKDVIPAATPAK